MPEISPLPLHDSEAKVWREEVKEPWSGDHGEAIVIPADIRDYPFQLRNLG
jgi:hypothetical protein